MYHINLLYQGKEFAFGGMPKKSPQACRRGHFIPLPLIGKEPLHLFLNVKGPLHLPIIGKNYYKSVHFVTPIKSSKYKKVFGMRNIKYV